MNANSFGQIFRVTTFGESHGPALGVIVDGCPSGVFFDGELLQKNLDRRRPGQSSVTTSRNELDRVEILSGVFEDKTLGTPIAMMVRNQDANSASYTPTHLETRRGHATDLWQDKFAHSDPRGSGRASGRETVCRVMAGSVAQMALKALCPELSVIGYVSQIGPISISEAQKKDLEKTALKSSNFVDGFETRLPHKELNAEAAKLLTQAKLEGDSFGGYIDLLIEGCPKALGQPVFHKMKADFASAFLGVGATASIRIGEADLSINGRQFHTQDEVYGGIRGGITTGESLKVQVGFKPPATVNDMAKVGRHDPCILPRAVPVIEAMANLVLVDHVLWNRLDRI